MGDSTFVEDSVSPHLTTPGQPYSPVELQSQFGGMNARDVYTLLCKRNGCRPVSSVVEMLPEKPGVWDVQSLNLSNTYIGPRGVIPLVELCKLLGSLNELSLADNYLTNDSVWHICKVCLHHPSLRKLNLSSNAISWTAGMCVLELVSRNTQIQRVVLQETAIKPKVIETINQQIRRNMTVGNRQARRGPNPSNHAATIRQRGLKRFFEEKCERDGFSKEQRLPKAALADGLRELWKLSGKTVGQQPPSFFEEFIRRAPSDFVDWESFMLLVMLEDVTFNSDSVEALRKLFNSFDADGAGYVEASDLQEMLEALNHNEPVTADELDAVMRYFDLDTTMTLNWDELLLLLYDHGPVVGELATLQTHTPLKRVRSLHR